MDGISRLNGQLGRSRSTGAPHPCPHWRRTETADAACWPPPGTARACAAPPAPWPGGCVLASGPQRGAGGPESRGCPEPSCSSRTGALLPSGGPTRTPTSAGQRAAGSEQRAHVRVCVRACVRAYLQWISVWIRCVYPWAAARWSSVMPRWRAVCWSLSCPPPQRPPLIMRSQSPTILLWNH